MSDRFEDRMAVPTVHKDTRLLGDFTAIWCRGQHEGRARRVLDSPAARLGVYGPSAPVVCEECADLLRYAETRRAWCPKDPKPFCSYCDTHCYKPEMRERMREVMRYAGPRSVLHGHAIDGLRHVLAGRRARRDAASAASRSAASNRSAVHNEKETS